MFNFYFYFEGGTKGICLYEGLRYLVGPRKEEGNGQ